MKILVLYQNGITQEFLIDEFEVIMDDEAYEMPPKLLTYLTVENNGRDSMSGVQIREEAIAAYNAAFDAVEAGVDFLNAIELSAASLHLWRQVGNDQNIAIGYWLYSRALAGAGVGSLAIEAADKSLEHLSKIESPADWLIASLNEGLARAYVAAGNVRADGAIAATAQLIESIEDLEDRALIQSQFISLPEKG